MGPKLIVLTLCFTVTVFIWGTAAQSTTLPPSSAPSLAPSLAPSVAQSSTPVAPNVTVSNSSTPGVPSTSDMPDNSTGTTVSGERPPTSDELSGGEIAGIVIGTLAGVALIGGGIYGVLKYTGKL